VSRLLRPYFPPSFPPSFPSPPPRYFSMPLYSNYVHLVRVLPLPNHISRGWLPPSFLPSPFPLSVHLILSEVCVALFTHLFSFLPFLPPSLPPALPPICPQEPSKLTLKEIDSVLEEIAHPKSNEDGKAKMVERLKIFSGLTGRMNPRELKWLVRERGVGVRRTRGEGGGGGVRMVFRARLMRKHQLDSTSSASSFCFIYTVSSDANNKSLGWKGKGRSGKRGEVNLGFPTERGRFHQATIHIPPSLPSPLSPSFSLFLPPCRLAGAPPFGRYEDRDEERYGPTGVWGGWPKSTGDGA